MSDSSQLKIRVALICGGQSPEHDISLLSAKNIFQILDKNKFIPEIIYIDKKGCFRYAAQNISALPSEDLPLLAVMPGGGKNSFLLKNQTERIININIDIVLPVLHGQQGEDGTIQGLFKMCGLPFVGSGVLSSAINMDKDVSKRLLQQANIAISEFLVFDAKNKISFEKITARLKLPFFIKPANAGSSRGVYKIRNKQQFEEKLAEIFQYYDHKIIAEEAIQGREIECAVLGNAEAIASLPGEIVLNHAEFYTYEAKYFDSEAASVVIPAKLTPTEIRQIQKIALEVFKILCCSGLARVDFFYTSDGRLLVNEVNTLPGFTDISMYPKCWEKTGISYGLLLEKLISLGMEKQTVFT